MDDWSTEKGKYLTEDKEENEEGVDQWDIKKGERTCKPRTARYAKVVILISPARMVPSPNAPSSPSSFWQPRDLIGVRRINGAV